MSAALRERDPRATELTREDIKFLARVLGNLAFVGSDPDVTVWTLTLRRGDESNDFGRVMERLEDLIGIPEDVEQMDSQILPILAKHLAERLARGVIQDI